VANPLPIGRPISRCFEAADFDKALQQGQLDSKPCAPILRQAPSQLGQEVTGQVSDSNPRQQQKAAVIGDALQMKAPLLIAPADKSIPIRAVPSGRSDQMHRQIASPSVLDQIEQVTTHGPIASQVMIAPEVTQRLRAGLRAVIGPLPNQGLEFLERLLNRVRRRRNRG
jgi:hypothetical protein